MDLIQRLETKAKAGVSNPSEVTPELLELALKEADEIIEKKIVSDTTKLDIAFFRLMLMIKKNGVDPEELDLYKAALKIVKDAATLEVTGETTVSNFTKVVNRRNIWE
ncbi:MAG: hypothetical protein AB7D41_03640 [Arcobacter sp.]|uniref:hypothetical protein n=1 Tax=Arcobacter sp. TaxID=1872629 RepID=UPI003D025FA3